jgi:Flp pilus assembly protein TadG
VWSAKDLQDCGRLQVKSLFSVSHWRRLRRSEDGSALVLVAFALMCFMLMAGMGLDVGYLQYQKQQMRKAADAGAIAAAAVFSYTNDFSKATVSAKNEVAANGYTDGINSISVSVNRPPQTAGDPFVGNSNYIEVIVAQPRPTFFMGLTGTRSVPVRGRSVSTMLANPSGCIYAMDPSSASAFLVDGNVSLGSNCGIYVNSSDTNQALRENGASSSITVTGTGVGIGVVGGYRGSTFSPTPVTGIPPFTDPLASIPAPAFNPASCVTFTLPPSGPIQPNCYKGGIRINGSGTYTFASGTYILYGGGLTIGGSASIVGSNVLFYNTGTQNGSTKFAPITLTGGTNSSLTAPTTGAQAGILFFQDRAYKSTTNPDTSVINAANGSYVGALYFPGTPIKFAGNPTVSTYTAIVAWQITINGNTQIGVTGAIAGGSPLNGAVIVE